MKRLFASVAVATLVIAGAALAQQQPSPVQPPPVKRTVLSKVEVPGANYDVITALVEIAPGFKAGRHSHPGTVGGQVLEGEIWFAIDGQPEKVAKAGEWIEIRDAAIHAEGAVGWGPMKVLAVYPMQPGKPRASPANEPPCPPSSSSEPSSPSPRSAPRLTSGTPTSTCQMPRNHSARRRRGASGARAARRCIRRPTSSPTARRSITARGPR